MVPARRIGVVYYLAALFFGAFPLPQRHPGAHRTMRYIGELLDGGTSILFFPEGEITDTGAISRFHPGVGMIAARLGATVVPVRLEGVDRVLHRRWKMARRGACGSPSERRSGRSVTTTLPSPGKSKRRCGRCRRAMRRSAIGAMSARRRCESAVSGSRPAGLTLIVAIAALAPARSQSPPPDPLAFLEPEITLTHGERARLDANQAVARALPGQDGQLAVLAATRLDAPAEALVAWTRAITAFKRSQFVLAIGRFSDPPVLSDLDALRSTTTTSTNCAAAGPLRSTTTRRRLPLPPGTAA